MTLDLTDAETIAARVRAWNGGGIMERSALTYQMSGVPGVDPYGWKLNRIEAAISTALQYGLIEEIDRAVCGTTYRARGDRTS